MKRIALALAAIAAGALGLQEISVGHGGTYRGPGDIVPPGGGTPTGGTPATPGPGSPGSPGPGNPGSPGPMTPGAPAGVPTGNPASSRTPGPGSGGPDLTLWQFWWGFNKEPYLELKNALNTGRPISAGDDEFFLGNGTQSQARDTYAPSRQTIHQLVVPALLRALEGERSKHIVSSCMIALAKIGDERDEAGGPKQGFARRIASFLRDPDQEIRETAAIALGILGDPDSIDLLGQLAMDTDAGRAMVSRNQRASGEVDRRTRAFATFGLGLLGYESKEQDERVQVVRTLIGILDGPARESATRDLAVAAVNALGLVELDSDPDFAPVGDSPTAGWECRQAQVRYLLERYRDEGLDHLVRAHCPIAMARLLQSPDPRKQWENAAESRHAPLKREVCRALLADLDPDARAQRELRMSAVLALGLLGDCDSDEVDAQIREALIAVPSNFTDHQVRNFSVVALARVGGRPGCGAGERFAGLAEVSDRLGRQLRRGKDHIRPWAGLALGVLEHARAASDGALSPREAVAGWLRAVLEDTTTPVEVGAFAVALGILGDGSSSASKELVREKLETTSQSDARGYCAVALGLMKDTAAKELIQKVVRESRFRPELLRSAAVGLGLLGDKDLVPDLIEMLGEAGSLSSQASITSALGFIGDRRSIEPLIAMLENRELTDLARGFAAVALGIVSDRKGLPWNAKLSVHSNYRASTSTLTRDGTGVLDIL